MRHIGSFLLGVIVGALTGSVFALLNAPYSGDKTREKIMDASDDLRKNAQKRLSESQRTVEKSVDEWRDRIADRIESSSKQLEHTAKDLRKMASDRIASR
jgi:gas vesicle protein